MTDKAEGLLVTATEGVRPNSGLTSQQQEPKLAHPDLILSPADALALIGYLDEGLGADEEELRLFLRIRDHANWEIERINAGLAR